MPKQFELSEPMEAFLDSQGLTVVGVDKDGNYILENKELGYQALMTRGFAESLGAEPGDVSVMADPDNSGRLWSWLERAFLVYCLVKEFVTYAPQIWSGRGDEYIPTTMQWFTCCDIINGVVNWR